MVYCEKCGAQNAEDAAFCVKCGATLMPSRERSWEDRLEAWSEEFGQRAEEWGSQFGKDIEASCVWLPRVGAFLGLIIGVIIILAGLRLLLGWNIDLFLRGLGALITITIGSLFVIFAAFLFSRRNR